MTTVLIWNNNHIGSNTYVGHASMNIGGQWRTKNDYVSWWPDEDANPFSKLEVEIKKNFLQDLEEEGYAPDHIIRLEGLDRRAMRTEWQQIRTKQNKHYQMARKNCSSIVARVLKQGSKDGSYVNRHSLIWTPLKVKRLALDMGGTQLTWQTLVDEAREDNVITQSEAEMLAGLYRRDARHGKASGNAAYYAKGRKINQKVTLMSNKFTIGSPKDGSRGLFADGGNIFGGTFRDRGTGIEFQRD